MNRPVVRRWLSQTIQGVTIRATLLVGFGLIFALWLVSAFHVTQRLAESQGLAETLHSQFVRSEDLLFTVRERVLLGSIYVRDYLIDPNHEAGRKVREQLETVRGEIQRALDQYLPEVDSAAKRQSWTQLEFELDDYWEGLVPVLAADIGREGTSHQAVLNDLIAKREVIIRISERIRALNQDAFRDQQLEVESLLGAIARRVWVTSGLAVVLGLGVAFLATQYAGGLEGRIRRQHALVLQSREDLARLSAKLVRAQEDERRKIARELHDEVGQALTAIKVQLALAERGLEGAPKSARTLAEARSMTEGVLHTIRDLCQLLRPPTLDDFGLPETVTSYLRGFSERTGIRATLVQERMEQRVSPDVEVCVYRIIQEALTNVARHAEASSCRVFLQRLQGSLIVTIEDDGKGVDLDQANPKASRGLGLVGVRERASELGGTCRFESTPGKGARLTVELPAGPVPHDAALFGVSA